MSKLTIALFAVAFIAALSGIVTEHLALSIAGITVSVTVASVVCLMACSTDKRLSYRLRLLREPLSVKDVYDY